MWPTLMPPLGGGTGDRSDAALCDVIGQMYRIGVRFTNEVMLADGPVLFRDAGPGATQWE